MASKKGVYGQVEIGAGAAPLGQIASITRGKAADEIDTTVMNAAGQASSVPGATLLRMELTVLYDAVDAGQVVARQAQGVDDTVTTIVYYPLGKTNPNQSFTGQYFILEDNLTQSADGRIEESIVAVSDGTAEAIAVVP